MLLTLTSVERIECNCHVLRVANLQVPEDQFMIWSFVKLVCNLECAILVAGWSAQVNHAARKPWVLTLACTN
jgi:hypothetical protein